MPLTVALFMDDGADGARGLLPEGETGALSHGPRWNSSTFILPPGEYPVEPYLPTVLLNRSDTFAPPMIPFVLPGGELRVTVERPDILILEGLNVLQTGRLPRDGKAIPYVSDFFDFSVYLDADEEVLNSASFKRREGVLEPGASVRLFGSVKLN